MKRPKHIKALDVALVIVAVVFITFTAVMIWTFWRFQQIPDTLATCFYSSCGVELVAAAWIETKKEKKTNEERDYSHNQYLD